jgi:hypothetical protein
LALIESSKPCTEDKLACKPQSTVLAELAKDAEPSHTPEGDEYATVRRGDHFETWLLKADGFRIG